MILKNQKMKIKITKVFLLSILTLAILSSCNKKNEYKGNVALVNDVAISQDLYSKELKFYQNFYTKMYGENYLDQEVEKGKTNNELLEKELVDSLIKDQVMLNELKEKNIKLDDSAATDLRNKLENELGGKDSLKANLTAIGLSEKDFNDILFRDSIRKQHYEYFLAHNNIKDSDILKFYQNNQKYQRMYKYNILVFDSKYEADKAKANIKSANDYKAYLDKLIKNYDVINSKFVYEDDMYLTLAKVKKLEEISDVFEKDGKFMILRVNSYNENENELLINLKDIYLKESYIDYLNKLTKKSKIRLFI